MWLGSGWVDDDDRQKKYIEIYDTANRNGHLTCIDADAGREGENSRRPGLTNHRRNSQMNIYILLKISF